MSGGNTTIDVAGNIAQRYNNMFYYLGEPMSGSTPPYQNLVIAAIEAFPIWPLISTIVDPTPVYGDFGAVLTQYMINFDINNLYTVIQEYMVSDGVVTQVLNAELAYMDDDLTMNVYPRINAGARDIGATNSTGYIYAKAAAEDSKMKALNKFSADIYLRMWDLGQDRWTKSLAWNKDIVDISFKVIEAFMKDEYAYLDKRVELATKNVLWPFTVLDYYRTFVGAVGGGQAVQHQSKFSEVGSVVADVAGAAALLA